MRNHLAVSLGLILAVAVGCNQQPSSDAPSNPKGNPAAEKAALEAAQTWLDLVDQGAYDKSWETGAASFKSAAPKEGWEKALQTFRVPLGKVVSRKLKSQQYATSLPGAPDGQYVVIQFDTSYEKKDSAVETVAPMLDEDGAWRVSGYFIK